MCNVKGEDSGEIKFVAKNIESTAYLEVEGTINLFMMFLTSSYPTAFFNLDHSLLAEPL